MAMILAEIEARFPDSATYQLYTHITKEELNQLKRSMAIGNIPSVITTNRLWERKMQG